MLERIRRYFKPDTKRRAVFDWLRVFSCIGIIGLHVTVDRTDALGIGFEAFFRLWLPMFFLLSGVLILTSEEEESIGAFYLKRIKSVVIPFFIYGAYYTCWINQGHAILELPTAESAAQFIRLIPLSWQQTFEGIQYFHLWFMYEIIGLYLIMPFLKIALRAMNEKTLKILFLCLMIMMALQDYLPVFGRVLTIDNYFAKWLIYLILGYILMQDFAKRNYFWILVLGYFTYGMALRLKLLHFDIAERVGNYYDLSPHMILQVAGVFAAFMLLEPILSKWKPVNYVMNRLSKYTFGIYLIHGYIISWWGVHYGTSNGTVYGTLHTVLFVFLLSLAFAFVFDNVITFNAQRGFAWFVKAVSKKGKKKEETA